MLNKIENPVPNPTEPKLAAPGAGLSILEMIILKFFIKPFILYRMDRVRAFTTLREGSAEITELLKKFKQEDLTKRILVKRPYFIEDSSRYWSAAMLCNHLGKVNGALAKAIETCFNVSPDQEYKSKDRLKAVKPDVEKNDASEIESFLETVERIKISTKDQTDHDLDNRLIPHPWLGNLTHIQWIWFAGFHMKVHARQLKRIYSGLKL